jgi:streptogramin lyase
MPSRSRSLATCLAALAITLAGCSGSDGDPSEALVSPRTTDAMSPSREPSAAPSTSLLGPPEQVELPPIADLGDQLVAHVPDIRPCDLAVGEDSVWVSLPDDRSIAEIDPASNEVARVVPLEILPCAIAYSAGSLWVASGDDLTSELVRVDPASGEALAVIDLPLATSIWAMADAGEGGVWALDRVNGTIVPIDPASNKAGSPIELGYGATDMDLTEGVAWISSDIADELVRVDVASREVEHVPAEFVNGGVAIDGRGVWALDQLGDRLTLIDAKQKVPILSWEFELEVGTPATANGGVWMPSASGALLVFDSESGDVAAVYGLPEGFSVAEAGLDSVWLLDREHGGGILRIVPDEVVPFEPSSAGDFSGRT